MNKKTILFPLISLAFIACGGSSGGTCCNNDNIASSDKEAVIERGKILKASIKDAKGQIGKEKEANSNIYTFENNITYPLEVTSGIIDVNGNGQIDSSDVSLNTKLISSKKDVSFLSTLVYDSDSSKESENINKLLSMIKNKKTSSSLSSSDLYKLPSSNKEIALFTNALYKDYKNQGLSIDSFKNKVNTNDTTVINTFSNNVDSLDNIINSNSSSTTSALAILLETNIVNDLKTANKLSTLSTSEVNKYQNKFDKNILSSASLSQIWDIPLTINSKDYNDFDIAIKFVKKSTGAIGEFIYEGLNLNNSTLSDPTYIHIYGKKADSTNGTTHFDTNYNPGNIINDAISFSGGVLTLKLSNIMKKQTIVSESSFRAISDYEITIISDKLEVSNSYKSSLNFIYPTRSYSFLNKDTINGTIKIK